MVKKINLAPTSPTNFLLSEKIDVYPGHRLLALGGRRLLRKPLRMRVKRDGAALRAVSAWLHDRPLARRSSRPAGDLITACGFLTWEWNRRHCLRNDATAPCSRQGW